MPSEQEEGTPESDPGQTGEASASPESMTSRYLTGEIIGDKYRLMRMLGGGGMGTVWVAQNIALDVPVAIKLIRADIETSQAADRLLQEARAAARLGHPAIVRIFDFGRTARGDPFIVMELLTGHSLAQVIEREERIPATRAVQILLAIAGALDTAHLKGIVHRDLKPDNIFLASDESGRTQPKVVDFGVAKLEYHDLDRKLTEVGSLLGSPDYMSPEQARGLDDVDHRTDIWAFCIVLYEIVSGKVPFRGNNYNALLRSIVEDEPPPLTEQNGGDAELWAIIERGLRKNRNERWNSMRELGEALALWLYNRGIKEDACAQSLRASWLEVSESFSIPKSSIPPPITSVNSLPLRVPAARVPSLDNLGEGASGTIAIETSEATGEAPTNNIRPAAGQPPIDDTEEAAIAALPPQIEAAEDSAPAQPHILPSEPQDQAEPERKTKLTFIVASVLLVALLIGVFALFSAQGPEESRPSESVAVEKPPEPKPPATSDQKDPPSVPPVATTANPAAEPTVKPSSDEVETAPGGKDLKPPAKMAPAGRKVPPNTAKKPKKRTPFKPKLDEDLGF